MADEESEIRVQVPLSESAIEKIDELAERMNVGRGRMAAMLLEEGLRDHEWVIRMVTSRFMKPVHAMVRRWGGTGKNSNEESATDVEGA